MKISICGKGGCGKSTVTTLLAKKYARSGKKVLMVNSDKSNFGLHRQLGVELPRNFAEYFGGKDKAFKKLMTGEILEQFVDHLTPGEHKIALLDTEAGAEHFGHGVDKIVMNVDPSFESLQLTKKFTHRSRALQQHTRRY